ncbi:hypothetical protein GLOIN_2v1872166 [Rhizophagus irregularis DAOM 181602=DAOM 197198]|uniref:G domain-containing protein n=1 Tax=Rhizophagus irregularis (strain DAOM 197198w) TaxID=1432141 RepID=A0A015K7R3_RHIIW|nr:hypothetical protein RirG_040760 [Rhizophagus irregularis DAOM 197198w]GBC29933.1 hypothetical protein GLOIN_2v1872166 [Rhizophagus irregularis DAOM 181602=DAOM 197198]
MHVHDNELGKKTILAIGGTGTGKSTFGRIVFGVNAIPGGGSDSITKQTVLYENDKYRYIDTPGFSDSGGSDDSEIFRNMLTLMQKNSVNNKFKIDFILWFCLESERCDQTLQRGASFIQNLVEYADLNEFDGNIWKSVLIIIKGPMLSPSLCEGSKIAAKLAMMKFINEKNLDVDECNIKVDHLACWIFDLNDNSSDIYKTMSIEQRLSWNVYLKDEIGEKVRNRISYLPFGVEIFFIQAKCKRCNCLGDPRLFDKHCHPNINPSPRHNIHVERYHPNNLIRDHSGAAAAARPASAAGPAGLAAGTIAGGIVGAAAGVILSSNEKCRDCHRSFLEQGCVKQCSGCNRFWGESGCRWKYTCCGWEETKSGCETRHICGTPECDIEIDPCICGACGMLLGTEGCTKDIEHDVVCNDEGSDTESF